MIKKESKNVSRLRRHTRVRSNISGTKEVPRLNVFRSNENIFAQIIDDTTGTTLVSSSSVELKIKNGGNLEGAKAVGKDIATKAKKIKITKVVFDRGGYLYHGRIEALAEAAREAGLEF
jgi:large subunit ribosomal protein L18